MAISGLLLERFGDANLTEAEVLGRLGWLRDVIGPRLERFLGYYRNPMTELAGALPCSMNAGFLVRPWRQYQEMGLPARITGFRSGADGSCTPTGVMDVQRKEVVIENDIAWRMNTLVDFAASEMPAVVSTAANPEQQAKLTAVIAGIFSAASRGGGELGAVGLLQELVLQGAIGGSAWVCVRPTEELLGRISNGGAGQEVAGEAEVARWVGLEVLEARKVCALFGQAGAICGMGDCRPAYVAVLRNGKGQNAGGQASAFQEVGLMQRVRAWLGRPLNFGAANGKSGNGAGGAEGFTFDIFGAGHWQRYEEGILREEGENVLGFVPFVRYVNGTDPAAGTRVGVTGSGVVDVGMGEVEPLIGLQDELNTRLSDRAYRVTMTSFRMYLGKGIEDFVKRPIGPGQMWGTDNLDAHIESFGGDQNTPSEDAHINEVREALDKISGVPAVAAGLIRGKLGNLSSAIALRLTLIALLARTERKRAALTQTMGSVVRMVLEMLDRAGVVKSLPEERGIDVNWDSALPASDLDRINEGAAKVALGVPRDVILKELGYAEVVAQMQHAAAEGARVEEQKNIGGTPMPR